jgi:hypothetical protein
VSLDQQYPESNVVPAMSGLTSYNASPMHSDLELPTFSFSLAQRLWMTQSSVVAPSLLTMSSSMPRRSSKPSTKRAETKSSATVEPDDLRWRVSFHREPAKVFARYTLIDPVFRPTLGDLVSALAADPKQFPKKQGRLKSCRAAEVVFQNGTVWRAVFTLDDAAKTVKVLALGPHDAAYRDAEGRVG